MLICIFEISNEDEHIISSVLIFLSKLSVHAFLIFFRLLKIHGKKICEVVSSTAPPLISTKINAIKFTDGLPPGGESLTR